jgi:hypothetical protein
MTTPAQMSAHFPITKDVGVMGPTNSDEHSVNFCIIKSNEQRLAPLDIAVSARLDDLPSRGLDMNKL